MSEGKVRVEREGPVGRLVLDNPERRNAISAGMWKAIPPAVGRRLPVMGRSLEMPDIPCLDMGESKRGQRCGYPTKRRHDQPRSASRLALSAPADWLSVCE